MSEIKGPESSPPPAPERVIFVGMALVLGVVGLCVWAQFRNGSPPEASTNLDRVSSDQVARDVRKTARQNSEATKVIPEAPRLEAPKWIWAGDDQPSQDTVWLTHSFELEEAPRKAVLRYTCDNEAKVFLGDELLDSSSTWEVPRTCDITKSLADTSKSFELRVQATNHSGPAGFIALVDLEFQDGRRDRWVSDGDWQCALEESAERWSPVHVQGEIGMSPWGQLPGLLNEDLDRRVTTLPGFEVELVYAVPSDQGSWVSLAVDDQGRILAGSQYKGLYRLTPPPIGSSALSAKVETLNETLGKAQGLLYDQGSLYVVVNSNKDPKSGLYRVQDKDQDDQFETIEKLRDFDGNGEHGPHSIVRGPDDHLYLIAGNYTKVPDPERSRAPRHWDEDHLLPRLWDASGHAKNIKAPGGWICRIDPEDFSFEFFCHGFRNPFDLAFNRDGELFTYDADMEWDMGSPWYRPTRLVHAVSGGEYGWRAGTGKWPTSFPDSLPPTLDIGPGSPAGLLFGYESHFPPRYQEAVYLLDWTFGTMYAAHLSPDGATYKATLEPFLSGRPLPLTDAVISPQDGCMYFAVGGRRVASAVYRVRYTGTESTEPSPPPTREQEKRELRQRLETFHAHDGSQVSDSDLDFVWKNLSHPDRFIRFAARVALEHIPASSWESRAMAEGNTRASLAALLALIRVRTGTNGENIVGHLAELSWEDMNQAHRLEWLRCLSLASIRLDSIELPQATRLRRQLEQYYPTGDSSTDRALCDLLVYYNSPKVVSRTLTRMEELDRNSKIEVDQELLARNNSYGQAILRMADAFANQDQVYFALSLRNAERGWTPSYRERYFTWFQTAKQLRGGRSFSGFLDVIRDEALDRVPASVKTSLKALSQGEVEFYDGPGPLGPGRGWTSDDVLEIAQGGFHDRNFVNGQRMFGATQCAQCHRFAGSGQLAGPDLSAVATRFTLQDLIEAIVEPSRSVSDQYAQTEFLMKDESVVLGRVMKRTETAIEVAPNLLDPQGIETIAVGDIVEEQLSPISSMFPGLVDRLNEEELLDLLAYLLSEGDPRSDVFRKPDEEGFISIFDGKSLQGWTGAPEHWSVTDGVIVGSSMEQAPAKNTFLIWQGGRLDDFELRGEVWLEGNNNSGIQYRSRRGDNYRMTGYQCDIHPKAEYSGMLYEEGGRGIMAQSGTRIRVDEKGKKSDLESGGSPTPLKEGWNSFAIMVKGHRLEHRINGEVSTVIVDDSKDFANNGAIALQLHAGQKYRVHFRQLRLRYL